MASQSSLLTETIPETQDISQTLDITQTSDFSLTGLRGNPEVYTT